MENSKTLTIGAPVDNIDLTLRLGFPFQDIEKQEDVSAILFYICFDIKKIPHIIFLCFFWIS